MSRPQLTTEQAAAVTADRGPAVVSAAAGSGKTRVLAERFCHLVTDRGLTVEQIVAVTFTERAAGEMRRRVASLFAERGMEAERRAAERSHITTIHGLASSILREHPAPAGVDPNFTIIDGAAAGLHLRKIFDSILSADPRYAEMLVTRGATRMIEAARALIYHERGRGREAADLFRVADDPDGYLEATMAVLATGSELLHSGLTRFAGTIDQSALSGKTAEKATRFAALVSDWPGEARRDHLNEIRECTLRTRNCPELSAAKDLIDAHRDLVPDPELEGRLALERLDVTRLAAEAMLRYEQLKASRGELDYDDLLVRSRNLLRDDNFIKGSYRLRWQALMVDEYQDTDPLQTEILGLLAPPERRFVVGDLRQSIYAFRNARPEIFEQAETEAQERGEDHSHNLAGNFRSVGPVIDFVNEFFARLAVDIPGGVRAEPMRAERPTDTWPLAKGPVVGYIPVAAPDTGEDSDASDERWARSFAEAEALAARVSEILESETVFDDGTGELRPARPGDIGILVRTRGETFRAIELAFASAEIPMIAPGGTRFYSRREVTDVLNMLRTVHNPLIDHVLAAVLRSPMVGLSDDGLVLVAACRPDEADGPQWRNGPSLWSGLMAAIDEDALPPGDIDRARQFVALRDELSAPHLGAAQIMQEAVRRTAYDTSVLARGKGTRELGNLQKLIAAAGRFDRRQGGGLGAFLDYVNELVISETVEPATTPDLEGDDAVRLLTMHAAKGLEFPVVMVAGLGGVFLSRTEQQTSCADDELGLTLKAYDRYGLGASPDAASQVFARRRKVERSREEEARLLYVAMTRSRDHLVLSGVVPRNAPPNPSKARRMIDWIRAVLPEPPPRETVELGSSRIAVVEAGSSSRGTSRRVADLAAHLEPGVKIDAPTKKADREAAARAIARISPAGLAAMAPAAIQATALRDFANSPPLYLARHILGIEEAPPHETGGEHGGGADLGLAVHRSLEFCDLSAEPGAEAARLVETCCGSLSPREAVRAVRQIEGFLSSDRAEALRSAEWILREAPLAVNVGDTIVHGVADLVAKVKTGILVIDYKTDVASSGGDDAIAAEYRLQLAVYALAASRSLGAEGLTAELALLDSGEFPAIDTTAEGIAQIEAEIAGILERLGRYEFGPADPPPPHAA